MAGRLSSRARWTGAVIALGVLAYPAYATLTCALAVASEHVMAADAPADKTKSERDCHKRCPDGGERLPQDRRSPLDSLPPLAPLVA